MDTILIQLKTKIRESRVCKLDTHEIMEQLIPEEKALLLLIYRCFRVSLELLMILQFVFFCIRSCSIKIEDLTMLNFKTVEPPESSS